MFSTKAPNEKRGGAARAALIPLLALAAAPALALDAGAAEAPGPDICLAGAREIVSATQVDARLELTLADGRLVRIAGLEPPPPAVAERAMEDLRLWALEGPLTMIATRATPDRWGRVMARVFVGDVASASAALAPALAEAGWARVDPGAEAQPCVEALYRVEGIARRAGRGLWGQARFAVLDARNPSVFAGREGEIVLIEGIVTSVGAGRVRSFVNFGPSWRRDAALVVSRRTLRALEMAGRPLEALVGRRVRARGLLEMRAGPRVEIFSPAALEFPLGGPDVPVAPEIKEP